MSYQIKPHYGLLQVSLMIALTTLLPDALSPMGIAALWLLFFGLIVLVVVLSTRLLPLVFLTAGALVGVHHGFKINSDWFDERLQGKDQSVSGRIVGLPTESGEITRFELKLDRSMQTNDSGHHLPRNIRLSWFGKPANLPEIEPGQRWQFTTRLRRPRGFASPGAFDYEVFLVRQGIQAIGYVKSGALLSAPGFLEQPFERVRKKLRTWLETELSVNNRGMLVALTTGDKSGILQEQWNLLNSSGTTHLMVISGLHIGLIATVGWGIAVLLARLGLLPLSRLPLPFFGGVFSLIMAILYSLLAGFSIPVQRAMVMLFVALTGPLAGIKSSSLTLWTTALTVVLLIDPLAVTSQGFWYSFMAVAALIFGVSGRLHSPSWLARLGRPQWVVFCVLTPLLLINGQAVSPLSPLINLVSIPLIGLLVVPLLLLSSSLYFIIPWLANKVLMLPDIVITGFNRLLTFCEPWLVEFPSLMATSTTSTILAVLGMFLFITPSALGVRYLAPFFLFPLLFPAENGPPDGQAKISVLDVGQGLSVLIRTRNHVLIYDTGDRFSDKVTAADRVILPAMASMGVKDINRVIISHGDKDHSGGLNALIKQFGPLDVWGGSAIPEYQGVMHSCTAGDSWQWDGVRFQMLAGGSYTRSNDSSCVLKVITETESLLLPGDISGRVELNLVDMGLDLASTKLVAAHHGSKHSSTSGFLEAVRPNVVIFSAGYGNRFRHPSKEVLSRAELFGIRVFNTATDGTLTFTLGSGNDKIDAYRDTHKRYWW